jgi:hypothetical protein
MANPIRKPAIMGAQKDIEGSDVQLVGLVNV